MSDNQEVGGEPPNPEDEETDITDFEQGLDELVEGLRSLPSLPIDFSREDIYLDHDWTKTLCAPLNEDASATIDLFSRFAFCSTVFYFCVSSTLGRRRGPW